VIAEERGSFVGPHIHQRATGFLRRAALVAALGSIVLLSGCSAETRHEWENFAMPDPASEQAVYIFDLWRYAWIAALLTGVVVWGLIFFSLFRYRRRHEDEIPIQTRYNLPLEIFYTIAPIIMVVVFFNATVNTQNAVLDDTEEDHVVNVVGQQWSWTFNYTNEEATGGEDTNVYESGTASQIPTLVLPVGETTQFNLYSPDVIHSFGIPAFLMRMDVVPGRINHFEVTPDTEGTFRGKCYELCGAYHSRMLFNVEVVSVEEFEQHLRDLQEMGNESELPVTGGGQAYTQEGLETEGLGQDDDEDGGAE
jgi:cytochrome c oxidase subunit 2